MPPTLILWCWAAAALLLGLLAADQLRRAGHAFVRRAFAAALVATALWALAMAGIGAGDLVTHLADGVRTLAWLGFMATLARENGRERRAGVAVGAVYGVVALVVVAGTALAVLTATLARPAVETVLTEGRLILAMMAAVSALVLTHHLHVATRDGQEDGTQAGGGGLRLVIGALAAMWAGDLAAATIVYLLGAAAADGSAVRGVVTLLLAPALAVAAHRDGEWALHLSRTVAVQSLRTVGVAGYAAAMLLGTAVIGQWAGPHARLWETGFVVGTGAALMTLLANPWLRAWTRVKLAKHLFRHRYDYRAEWVRFTDTLGRAEAGAPLDRRIVQAVADLTTSPAGLLLVPDGEGLGVGAGWNWPAAQPGGDPLARHLAASARILELDAVRAGTADPGDAAAVPAWMLAHDEAWAVVPLIHFGALAGAILLARPPIDRALDWEDLDLLRIAGRQVASYLAEARAQAALAEGRRFDEFSRRFAFIVHDIKNLVSQLSLVARNAERHADNPAFRADMVATLRDSADRMNALLARLSQHHGGRAAPPCAVDLMAVAQRIARRRRAQHPVVAQGEAGVPVLADEARLEQLLEHLVQNAIEASAPGAAVTLVVGGGVGEAAGAAEGAAGGAADRVATIAVVDTGCGMTPAFVRDELFRAFHSSKPGGFGIGAFEARQLAEAMGGGVTVDSREGEGTRFTVRLPMPPPGAGTGAGTGTATGAGPAAMEMAA